MFAQKTINVYWAKYISICVISQHLLHHTPPDPDFFYFPIKPFFFSVHFIPSFFLYFRKKTRKTHLLFFVYARLKCQNYSSAYIKTYIIIFFCVNKQDLLCSTEEKRGKNLNTDTITFNCQLFPIIICFPLFNSDVNLFFFSTSFWF